MPAVSDLSVAEEVQGLEAEQERRRLGLEQAQQAARGDGRRAHRPWCIGPGQRLPAAAMAGDALLPGATLSVVAGGAAAGAHPPP